MDFRRRAGVESSRANSVFAGSLTAIHWIHRLIALITLIYLAALAIRLARVRGLTGYGTAVAGLVLAEAGLGIASVAAGLPLLGCLATTLWARFC